MLVNFTYSKEHGNSKKGDTVEMYKSTADALEAHGIGKVEKKAKEPKK